MPLTAIRMVHLTIQHGLSVHSASGFSFFASILCQKHQNVKDENHIGKTALLLQKLPSKETAVNVTLYVYVFVKWHVEHISALMKPLLNTYKISLETGNHEKTEMAMNYYCIIILLSGQSMTSLEQGIATFAETRLLNKCIPMAIEKLISIFVYSRTRDPNSLIKELIQDSTHYKDNAGRSYTLYLFCLIAAMFFGAFDLAMKLIQVEVHFPGTYMAVVHAFAVGLVSLSTAKNSRDKTKMINTANECI